MRTTRSAWGLLAGLMALAGLAAWGMVATTQLRTRGRAHDAAGVLPRHDRSCRSSRGARHARPTPTRRGTARSCRRCSRAPNAAAWSRRRSSWSPAAAAVLAVAPVAVAVVSGRWLAADGVAVSGPPRRSPCCSPRRSRSASLWSAIGLGVGVTVSHQVARSSARSCGCCGRGDRRDAFGARWLVPARARKHGGARHRRRRRVAGGPRRSAGSPRRLGRAVARRRHQGVRSPRYLSGVGRRRSPGAQAPGERTPTSSRWRSRSAGSWYTR